MQCKVEWLSADFSLLKVFLYSQILHSVHRRWNYWSYNRRLFIKSGTKDKGISTMIIAYFQVAAAIAHQTNNNNNFSDSKSWENSTSSELFLLFITGWKYHYALPVQYSVLLYNKQARTSFYIII